ncbi:hypothetical protein TNCV_874241 [Trichonephila clavipes]|nr:hypothetical protein TNCV_874241 [Trichonephila clavipes]
MGKRIGFGRAVGGWQWREPFDESPLLRKQGPCHCKIGAGGCKWHLNQVMGWGMYKTAIRMVVTRPACSQHITAFPPL